ncbi:hypothetical protein U1Q18_039472 [Sarracenia purpurea var. burkii]
MPSGTPVMNSVHRHLWFPQPSHQCRHSRPIEKSHSSMSSFVPNLPPFKEVSTISPFIEEWLIGSLDYIPSSKVFTVGFFTSSIQITDLAEWHERYHLPYTISLRMSSNGSQAQGAGPQGVPSQPPQGSASIPPTKVQQPPDVPSAPVFDAPAPFDAQV